MMNSESCIDRGDLLHANGDLEGALALYATATILAPDDIEAWTSQGNIQSELRRWDQAAESYRRALGIEPDDEDLRCFHERAVGRSMAYAVAARKGVSNLAGGPGSSLVGTGSTPTPPDGLLLTELPNSPVSSLLLSAAFVIHNGTSVGKREPNHNYYYLVLPPSSSRLTSSLRATHYALLTTQHTLPTTYY